MPDYTACLLKARANTYTVGTEINRKMEMQITTDECKIMYMGQKSQYCMYHELTIATQKCDLTVLTNSFVKT